MTNEDPLLPLDALDQEDRELSGGGTAARTWSELTARLHDRARTALCFSGGGIRSASFGLGVLQALAERSKDPGGGARPELLGQVDYLSTVSGGGYLGSWFSAWATRLSRGTSGQRIDDWQPDTCDGPGDAIRQLASHDASRGFDPDVDPVKHLREYSNYLIPALGLMSGDTWAAVGSVVRNMVLNWLVLIPLAAAVLVVPLAAAATAQAGVANPSPGVLVFLLLSAFLPGVLATAYVSFDLPSAGDARHGYGPHLFLCLIPLAISAIQFNLLWAWLPVGNPQAPPWDLLALGQTGLTWKHFGALGAMMHGGGMLIGIVAAMFYFKRPAPKTGLIATLAAVFTGFVGGAVASRFALLAMHPNGPLPEATALIYTVFAFPIVVGVFLLAGSLLVGLTSYVTQDKDREWWARSGGLLLALGLGWPLLAAIVLFVPPVLIAWTKVKIAIHGATGIAGWAASQLAGSSRTPAVQNGTPGASPTGSQTSRIKDLGAQLLLPVFLILLAVSIAILNSTIVGYLASVRQWIAPGLNASLLESTPLSGLQPAVHSSGVVWLLAVLYVGFAVGASFFINVNSFSLHAMYRQRLIRAYLGASNNKRSPNRFTGFDETDNLPMCALTKHRPFHVVNMALNLVHGSNLAWQERKAESFTVTRLHAGSCRLAYRPSSIYGGRYRSAPSKTPISLGTAMTISGAAASPNMGYNSSPLLTLVMTLFNARLGWWLGNPKHPSRAWKYPGPWLGIRSFVDEALGLTDDANKWIYLSDGGHFENLGLYEMVLRRCHIIIVSDAGADPDYAYEDLGNAVRKIRIDLGISIEFDRAMPMSRLRRADPNAAAPGHHCAIGRIRYSLADPGKPDGLLVYLKPSLTGDEPSDVLHFATTDPTFPHQTTVDQFFGEAQFESYRRLGAHVIERICQVGKQPVEPPEDPKAPDKFNLAEFVERAKRYAASATP